MYFVPFIYFSALTYYFWQKHRTFDLAVYMSLLFAFTSLCAIIMVLGNFLEGGGVLVDGWDPEFGLLPTLTYCLLITVTIFPFSLIRPEKLQTVSNIHRYLMLAFSIFIVLQGLVVFYIVGGSITDLLNGDFKFLKDSGYAGDMTIADAKVASMSFPIQFLYYFSFITLLGIPLFFYYSCIENRSLWLTMPLLIASISPVERAVMGADRTEIVHYGLMFLFSIVFFQRFIGKKVRNFLVTASIPVVILASVYVIAVSASRFDESEAGTGGSIIEYAGQSYVNFCFVYDNHNPDLVYFEREFPMTHYLIFHTQYTETKEERTAKEGFFVGIFASHIGSWFLDGSLPGSVIISLTFALICCLVIRYYNRTSFDIGEVFMLFILGAVPTFGIFYYRYYSIATSIVVWVAFFFYLFSKVNIVWGKDSSSEDS